MHDPTSPDDAPAEDAPHDDAPAVVLTVDGHATRIAGDPTRPLLAVLRDDLGQKGTRFGCGLEQCGACTVLIDGEPAYSCSREIGTLAGRRVTTLEGLTADGRLHPVQQAILDEQAGQCGYCLSGMVMAAVALLAREPSPSRAAIVAALDPHLCRCGVQNRIVRAVERAARAMAAAREKTPA